MTPLPKRKHSTRRKGKRLSSKAKKFPALMICKNCGKSKMPNLVCKHCQKE